MTDDDLQNEMVLIHKETQEPVEIGEVLTDFRGDKMSLVSVTEPRHPGSTGRVWVVGLDDDIEEGATGFGYYPSVFNLEWRK